MTDEALALAALKAGIIPYPMSDGAWAVAPHHPATNHIEEASPAEALAAAARALGLKPDVVVVPVGAARKALEVPPPVAQAKPTTENRVVWVHAFEDCRKMLPGDVYLENIGPKTPPNMCDRCFFRLRSPTPWIQKED